MAELVEAVARRIAGRPDGVPTVEDVLALAEAIVPCRVGTLYGIPVYEDQLLDPGWVIVRVDATN